MSKRSRRDRGQHPVQGNKRQDALAKVVRQQVTTETYEPAVPVVPMPSPNVPISAAKPTGAQSPHIIAELRRIAILAGIILAILVVLALVLP